MEEKRGVPSSLPEGPIVPQHAQQGQQGISIEQALALAAQHHKAGRLQEAEKVLRQILAALPDCAPAVHLLGVIAHQVGRTELGAELVGKAIAIDGSQALFHANRGEMCRLLGRLEEAVSHGERAVALNPSLPIAHGNLGIALFDQGEFDRAEACQRRALELAPDFSKALNNLGSICRERNDPDAAIDSFKKAIAADPDYVEPLNNLGAVLLEEERLEEAIPILQNALKMRPNYAEAHCNLGCCYRQQEKLELALSHLASALANRPIYPEAQLAMAGIRLEQEKEEAAEAIILQALAASPDKAELHAMLGSICNQRGFSEQAEAAFEKAFALDGNLISAYNGLGTMRMEQGAIEEAEASYRKALEIDPDKIETRFNIALVKKFKPEDPDLAHLEAKAKNLDSLPVNKAMQVHFALGKAYDDVEDYDRAFPHFLKGCRLKRSRINYDEAEMAKTGLMVRQIFDVSFIRKLRRAGDPSTLPIFILGMPRSGTTLVEQIVSSHPVVYGAGELRDVVVVANEAGGKTGGHYPANMESIPRVAMTRLGTRYVERLRQRAPDAERITDKLPANFLLLGFIHLMLPRAKIIHVMRSPLDTCLSNFTRLFGRNQFQSYDLRELGLYYAEYARIMEHWRTVLPEGAFLDLRYEDLVADTETQTRHIISYLGLEWDDACLAFHESKRQVRTASLTQVRQPIYKSSIGRWRRYERFLSPLIEALGDYADAT